MGVARLGWCAPSAIRRALPAAHRLHPLALTSLERRESAVKASWRFYSSNRGGGGSGPSRLIPFQLERFFARYEFVAPYILCSSDCEPIKMSELITNSDAEVQGMWQDLTLSYTESRGHPVLLEEISSIYRSVPSSRIVTGVPQELIYLFMRALLQSGDRIVSTYPGYQSLTEIAVSIGCKVHAWTPDTSKENPGHISFSVDKLEEIVLNKGPPPKLVVINFPHNPTGCMLTHKELIRVIELCEKTNTILFSDEMYRGLERSEVERLFSVCDSYERGVTLAGMSKVYGLPGVRMGWLSTGEDAELKEVFQRVLELKDYTTICSPGPCEILSIAALRQRESLLQRCRSICQNGLDAILKLTNQHSDIFSWETPPGGSTGFAGTRVENLTSKEFSELAVESCGVLMLPGECYLPSHPHIEEADTESFGEQRVRLAFGRANAPEAAAVLSDWLVSAKANGQLKIRNEI